ncbi:hypothetical protein GCM10007857_80470 [Bradyrhizobium iriomotense]|uniref:Uncharacterized protein n=1 Tax=Bradyrhizobium iriomotense TaxID=441950 RepID=A0ABQ6BEG2_9BRAD|nr:hypothetical protein GCM10007857_80470 [Bradyrhizobium iriomotense]
MKDELEKIDPLKKIEQAIKRPLREGERARIGGLVLADQWPRDRRKRRRAWRKALKEAQADKP